MKAVKITESRIEAMRGNRITDNIIPGFCVRAYASGRKSYCLRVKIGGRWTDRTIGDARIMTLTRARELAKAALTLDRSDNVLFVVLKDRYLQHAERYKKTWKKDKQRLDRHCISWLHLHLSDITNDEIDRLHAQITIDCGPYEANRTLEIVKCMFNLAIRLKLHDGQNPAIGIKKNREEKRDRWAKENEVKAIMSAVENESQFIRAAIKLYLLTGLRKNELLKLKWSSVDLARAELRIENTKNGRTHYLPLSKQAVQILRNLERVNDYVLPGRHNKNHIVNIEKPWARIKSRAGVDDLRIHDLRRTCGSLLAQKTKDLRLVGQVLNQSQQSVTATYAHHTRDQMRDALELLSESMQ